MATQQQAQMAAYAGLALAATPEARKSLAEAAPDAAASPRVAEVHRKALSELQKVRALGIRSYTEQKHEHH